MNFNKTMDDKLSEELTESMKLVLTLFEEALHTVLKKPDVAYKELAGNSIVTDAVAAGMTWELRQELLAGKSLTKWNDISKKERSLIGEIIRATENLPPEAYGHSGQKRILPFFKSLNLSHPSWKPIRQAAREFLVERNREDLKDEST